MQDIGNGMMALYEACQADLVACKAQDFWFEVGMWSIMAVTFGVCIVLPFCVMLYDRRQARRAR